MSLYVHIACILEGMKYEVKVYKNLWDKDKHGYMRHDNRRKLFCKEQYITFILSATVAEEIWEDSLINTIRGSNILYESYKTGSCANKDNGGLCVQNDKQY